ncbi:hypothetical protein Slin14017_G054850 [Septoria linicola]|nr:hypothetical protein Slin14017_G054850 [Septoria linicola]
MMYLGQVASLLDAGYWTRKWIIQETVLAFTLILQLGDFEFSMHDLANILAGLERPRNLGRLYSNILEDLQSLPFARLAAYRRDRSQGTAGSELLSDLLPLYRDHQCGAYQDHVYALYNLIGAHRVYLDVDYEQHALVWHGQVLSFSEEHEPQYRNNLVSLAHLLASLTGQHDLSRMPSGPQKDTAQTTARAFDRGRLEMYEDCINSTSLRKSVESLHPGVCWALGKDADCWQVTERADSSTLERISRRVLSYFRVPEHSLCGLAATRIANGDRVWHFLNTQYAFIVRPTLQEEGAMVEVRILGRCYLFEYVNSTQKQPGWLKDRRFKARALYRTD